MWWVLIVIVIGAVLFLKMNNSEHKMQDKSIDKSKRNEFSAIPDWEATWRPTTPVKDSGKCGQNVDWKLYEDGQLIITGSGKMFDYKPETSNNGQNVTPWYQYRMFIRSAKVGKGITYLGDWVFGYCKNLEDVVLSCTTETMPWGGFFECEKLKIILIPNGTKRIRSECFLECTSLSEVKLPYGVNEIGETAFSGCKSLTDINLPESLTDIEGYAFSHCPNLRNIRIPRGTTYIHEKAFYNSGVNVSPRG